MTSHNITSILTLLNDTIVNNFTVQLKIPSLEEGEISIKPLNISQQKSLISLTSEKNVYNSKFLEIIFNIIKENYLSNDLLNINDLTVLDKTFITLALRASINPVIGGNNILEHIKDTNINSLKISPSTFTADTIKIVCGLPTILQELECEHSKTIIDNENISKNLQQIISESILVEITKYIKHIYINDNFIDMTSMIFTEKQNIIEALPAVVLEQVLQYILDSKKKIENILKFTDTNNQPFVVTIDSNFFATA